MVKLLWIWWICCEYMVKLFIITQSLSKIIRLVSTVFTSIVAIQSRWWWSLRMSPSQFYCFSVLGSMARLARPPTPTRTRHTRSKWSSVWSTPTGHTWPSHWPSPASYWSRPYWPLVSHISLYYSIIVLKGCVVIVVTYRWGLCFSQRRSHDCEQG